MNINKSNLSRINAAGNSEPEIIDFGKFYLDILDNIYLIIIATLIFSFLSLCYSLIITPIYSTNSLVQVEDNSGGSLVLDDLGGVLSSESSVATEIYIIKSRYIIGQTVDELNLTTRVEPNYFPLVGESIARSRIGSSVTSSIFGNSYAWGRDEINVSFFSVPEEMLLKNFTLIAGGNQEYSLWLNDRKLLSGVVGDTLNDADLDLTISVDKLIANKGTKFNISKTSRLSSILRLKRKVRAIPLGKDTGIMLLTLSGSDKVAISKILNSLSANYVRQNVKRLAAEAVNSLIFIKEQMPHVQNSLAEAESALNSYRSAHDSVDLNLEAKSLLETLVSLDAEISLMAFNEEDISRRFTKEHPSYLSFQRQKANLLAEQNRINRKVNALPNTQQQILTLKRDFESSQSMYISLQNKTQELEILKASTVGNVRILDVAEVFPQPIKPQRLLIVVLGSILGFFVSILFVLVRASLNKGVSSHEELYESGFNVYASIPTSAVQAEFDKSQGILTDVNNKDKLLLARDYPSDLAVEALRSLRTSIHFSMLEANRNNVLMISSATASVGKSFVCLNLCSVVAQTGKKVLLIDCDLRRGKLHKTINSTFASAGLSHVLSGAIPFSEAIFTDTGIETFDFISRGVAPSNPSELLTSNKLDGLIENVSKLYDLIVIDTPPILAVTDAAVVGRFAGTSMLVSRFNQSTLNEMKSATDTFSLNGIDITGVIFNAIRVRSKYYGKYGYYSYKYESVLD